MHNGIPSPQLKANQMESSDVQCVSRPGRLCGKVALIIGAGSGIGECAARLFAKEGSRCAGGHKYRCSFASGFRYLPGTASRQGLPCRRHRRCKCQHARRSCDGRFRPTALPVQYSGGSLPQDSLVTDVPMDVWDKTMTLDVKGSILACRYAIPKIIESGGGNVVIMSSGAALRGSGKAHVYAAAKGAIVSLTRNLAGAYAKHGVRVNAICSGRVNTQRVRETYGIPGQPGNSHDAMQVDETIKTYPFWFGEPEDMANIALFLASDESRMITGASIPADGGRSAY